VAYTTGSGSGFGFTPNDNGTYVVTLNVTDKDGGVGTTSRTVTVANVAPTVLITNAPASGPEGTAISLASGVADPGSLDTITYAWSAKKDGVAYKSGSASTFNFTPNDNGTYLVTLTVTDKDGGSNSTSATITGTNVAPTPTIIGVPETNSEGTAINVTGSATDAGGLDTTLTYAWSVTKGGAAYASGTGTAFSFTPNDNASYAVTLNVTDKDGGVGTTTRTIAVTNVAPTVTIGGAAAVTRGATYTLAMSTSDAGTDTISGWTIDWGDGDVETVSGNPNSATHTYGANGDYTISASAQDEDGTYAAAAAQGVSVVDQADLVAPTATLGPISAATAGATGQTFMVFYSDNVGMSPSTFGDQDVLVTGPNGFSQMAHFVSYAVNLESGMLTATYRFTPPGGAWAYTANGSYTFTMQANQVSDGAGNAVAGGTLGSFVVRLAVPDLGGNTLVDAQYLGIVSPGYGTTSVDYVSKGDRNDYFRLRLKAAAPVDVKLYGMTDDADLQLLDGNGKVIQTSARAGTRSEIITRTLAAGTYYLRTYYSYASSTQYYLRVSSTVATPPLPDNAGNSIDAATYIGILAPPLSATFNDALDETDANDYYRLRLKQQASVDVVLSGLTADAQLSLLDVNGVAIRTSRNAGATNEVVSRTLAAGTYYLRVFSEQSIRTQYAMSLKVANPPTVAAAPVPVLRPTLAAAATPFSRQRVMDGLAA
jgi:hypothetical protein